MASDAERSKPRNEDKECRGRSVTLLCKVVRGVSPEKVPLSTDLKKGREAGRSEGKSSHEQRTSCAKVLG